MGLEAPRTDYPGSNVSSTCNSAGSALWALTKNMKPLIDANCHAEAIETANERSPVQFSPILYKSNSGHPAGQTILFGCRPELRTDGRQNKAPPVLEYLLQGASIYYHAYWRSSVGQYTEILTNDSLYGRRRITGL